MRVIGDDGVSMRGGLVIGFHEENILGSRRAEIYISLKYLPIFPPYTVLYQNFG